MTSCFADTDQDGYGSTTSIADNGDSDGHRPDATSTVPDNGNFVCTDAGEAGADDPTDDCNDNDPPIYPGAVEICDNKDNNCNADDSGSFWILMLPAILNGSNHAP